MCRQSLWRGECSVAVAAVAASVGVPDVGTAYVFVVVPNAAPSDDDLFAADPLRGGVFVVACVFRLSVY